MIDELAMLTAYGDRSSVRDALRLLAEVLTQGRAADHGVAGYVQEPTKDVVDVRELFDTRICLGVTAACHVDMALGDGARDRGALADEIPGDPDHAGIGFVIDTGSRLPVRFRAGWVTDGDIDDLAARCAPRPAHRTPHASRATGDVVPFPRTPPPHRTGTEQGGRVMNTDTSASATTPSPPPCSPPSSGSPASAALLDALLDATGHPVLVGARRWRSRPRSSGRRGGWPAGAGAPRRRRRRPGRGRLAGRAHAPPRRPASTAAVERTGRGWPDVGRHRLGDRYLAARHPRPHRRRHRLLARARRALRRLLAHLRRAALPLRATCPASCCASGPTKPASAAGGGTDDPPDGPADPAAVLADVVGLAGLAALLTAALDATGHPVLVGLALVLTAVGSGRPDG